MGQSRKNPSGRGRLCLTLRNGRAEWIGGKERARRAPWVLAFVQTPGASRGRWPNAGVDGASRRAAPSFTKEWINAGSIAEEERKHRHQQRHHDRRGRNPW